MIRIAIITAETRCFVFLLFILNITAPIRLLTDCHQSNSERILYMKLIILASLILFSACLSLAIKRGRRAQAAEEKSFWEREREANSVRRKPLDNLDYITIPFEHLPVNRLTDDPTVSECLEILQNLSELHIVNLTGFSNTDLKLEYGAANITALSEYDQNYTLLARTLQKMVMSCWKMDSRMKHRPSWNSPSPHIRISAEPTTNWQNSTHPILRRKRCMNSLMPQNPCLPHTRTLSSVLCKNLICKTAGFTAGQLFHIPVPFYFMFVKKLV